jgi:hypothetical protein
MPKRAMCLTLLVPKVSFGTHGRQLRCKPPVEATRGILVQRPANTFLKPQRTTEFFTEGRRGRSNIDHGVTNVEHKPGCRRIKPSAEMH